MNRTLLVGYVFVATLAAASCSGPAKPATSNPPMSPTSASTVSATPPASPIVPAEPPVLNFPDEAFRAVRPGPAKQRPFAVPKVKQFSIGGQIDAYLIERHTLPTISLRLQFEGGSVNDPNSKIGLASICMAMLVEGTAKLDKLEYKATLADMASSISVMAGQETQMISLATLTRNFPATFRLWKDTLLNPGFRQAELDRLIKRSLERLHQQRKSVADVARRVENSVLYGPTHPFGKITNEATLKAISIEDCKNYHRTFLQPRRAKLFVVGDLTEQAIRDQFGKLLGEWKGTPPRTARLPRPRTRKGKIFFVDIPGAAQSMISIKHFGPKRLDRNYFANKAMSDVIGGSFSARVNMNLREDKGYSYGARASLGYWRNYGVFTARSSVRANSTRQSILEFYREIEAFRTGQKPATPDEIMRDQNSDILGIPARFATARRALGTFSSLIYFGLPLNYYETMAERIKRVTAKDIAAAAGKNLHPKDAVIVVVGDGSVAQITRRDGKDVPLLSQEGKPVTLKMALAKLAGSGELGRGKLVVLDADGNVQ